MSEGGGVLGSGVGGDEEPESDISFSFLLLLFFFFNVYKCRFFFSLVASL